MIWLYRILFLPSLLLLAPRYLRRMRRRGGYREHFRERFGLHFVPRRRPDRLRVWLQAVSVGEMLAIGPILDGLQKDGVEIYLTTTTSTGFRIAGDRYRRQTLGIGYFPIDWWPFSARAWRRIDPDAILLTEGERWPEHLNQARKRGAPVIVINARMSDRSFRRLRRFPPAARMLLGGVTRLLPSSAEDEARFRALKFPQERMARLGSIKLDVAIPVLSEEARAGLRADLGLGPGFVLLGSSTWPGEEEALIAALRRARAEGLVGSLLIVPRHAERRFEIDRALRKAGLKFHFRSKGPAPEPVDVAVGDTTGELRYLTQVADLVFVGKSLLPHTEGQTPVEAAILGKPILFGPGMGNFYDIANDLMKRGAAVLVEDAEALARESAALLRDGARRRQLAAAAEAWHRENAGAVVRTLEAIRSELAPLRKRA
jgi:3-deoxy-D-manno-octulosonic-acid transferase